MAAAHTRQTYTIGLSQAHTGVLSPFNELAHTGIPTARIDKYFNDGLRCGL